MTICLQNCSSLCPKRDLHQTSPVLGEPLGLLSQLSSRGYGACNTGFMGILGRHTRSKDHPSRATPKMSYIIQLNRGYTGTMEKTMETTIMGLGL